MASSKAKSGYGKAVPHEKRQQKVSIPSKNLDFANTRAALSRLSYLYTHRRQNLEISKRLARKSEAFANRMSDAIKKSLAQKTAPGPMPIPSLPPSASEIEVDGAAISGWFLYPKSGHEGVLVEFSGKSASPFVFSSIEVKGSRPMPAKPVSPSHVFRLASMPPDAPHDLVELSQMSCTLGLEGAQEKQLKREIPGGFQVHWGAFLAESIAPHLPSLPEGARARLSSELEAAISRRQIVIESEVGDGCEPVYFLSLPSFSISFRVMPDGSQYVLGITGKEKFLFWVRAIRYFTAEIQKAV